MNTRGDLSDTYFRRLFLPCVITILVIFAIVVIIYVPSGTPLQWPTFPIASQKSFTGGFLKMK